MAFSQRKIICALDVSDIEEAKRITRSLSPFVGAFKIGHALTLQHGLDVIDALRREGADRIFLDLKFHDIPNSVALAVKEAARRGVWMITVHISGGPAMVNAAAEEAHAFPEDRRPLLVGVSVLTSLDQHNLTHDLGIQRSIEEHMVALSRMACDNGLDGVVCSAQEIRPLRAAVGHNGIIVTPGIRLPGASPDDQRRVGSASQALSDGADYLVIGRALIQSPDPAEALSALGLVTA